MAFPSIRSQVTDSITANETTHTVSLPATIVAGDTIVVLIRCTVAGAFGWPDSSWNVLFDASDDASDDQMAAAWKEAVGNEGGTTISITSGNGKFTSVAIAVQDATNPRKTPPFLGTVGTGVSPNEPNPGNCNPAAGAKDYLWWTFYGMEGEQTGITAYPANYTLNQSGLVNTGTGGAVTTNCTMASAARQLNASSEDAGVWDVTGTIDDWTARTIAFHPAESVGAQVLPTNFPTRLPQSLTILTVAINLLQSTLAPEAAPFFQTDWPNPQPIQQQPINYVDFYDPIELETGLMGFNQYDWPNPAPIPRQLLVNISSRLSDEIPPIQSVYDNPLLKKANIVGWTFSRQLEEEIAIPFIPVDLSIPLTKNKILITIESGPQDDANLPVTQIEWNNPLFNNNSATRNKFWTNNNLLDTLTPSVENPVIPNVIDNPKLGRQQNVGFNRDRPQYYVDESIKFATEFRNPDLVKKQTLFWSNNNLQNTIEPEEEALPPVNPITLVPFKKSGLMVGISSVPIIEPSIEPPRWNQFVNPLRKKLIAQTWIQERKQYYDDIKPFNQNNYPNPALNRSLAITYVHIRKLEEPAEVVPFIPNLFPASISKKVAALTFIKETPFILQTVKPDGIQIYSNSILINKSVPNTIIQARPFYYEEPSLLALQSQIFNNPFNRKITLITDSTTRFPEPSGTEKPFNEIMLWPNPVLRPKVGQYWTDYFIIDQNQPPIAQFTSIPLRKKFFNAPHVQQSQLLVATSGTPLTIADWQNPIHIHPPVHTLIVNLLQTPFDIQLGDKPFFEDKWPNPIIPNRILHTGWIWEKRFFATEEPLQPAQYDWPIFRPIMRAHTGYVFVQKQDASPLFTSVTEIPLNRRIIAVTFVDNPIKVIIEPPGLIPFNQINWPIVTKKRIIDIYTINGVNYIILPQAKGRTICLLADATEYELFAELEGFDLDAAIVIFDLDAGGTECE